MPNHLTKPMRKLLAILMVLLASSVYAEGPIIVPVISLLLLDGPQGPDLIVINPSVDDNTLTPGQPFIINATTKNQGNASSTSTILRYYYSTDSTISTSDIELGTDMVGTLSAGITQEDSLNPTAPINEGTYWVGACVDTFNGELNVNNQCSTGVSVIVSILQSPDLIVINPSVDDNTLTPGQPFIINATTKNQGTGGSESTTLRYYYSTDSTISTGDTEMGTDLVGTLSAGSTQLDNLNPATAPIAGSYWVGACVDTVSGELVVDNQCSTGVSIEVSNLPSPDLIVMDLSASNAALTLGEGFTIDATTKNQGNASSTSTILRYYYSTDSTISTGDTELGTDMVGALTAGSTQVDTNKAVTAPNIEGTYWIGACVDTVSGELVVDNQCSAGIQVEVTPPGPDLVVAVSVSDSALGLGESFDIDATTKNQGNENSESTTLRYYSSPDPTITISDAVLGTDSVGVLTPGATEENSMTTSIANEGIYWIGACVDMVTDETNTNNQCSDGVPIDVTDNVPDYAGKYCGSAAVNLITQGPVGAQRFLMIDIAPDDSVQVTGEDYSVAGNLSGTTLTASIPIDITDDITEPVACSGTLNLSGEVALPMITGAVPGTVLCSGIVTLPVVGTFTTIKTYGTTCQGIP